LLSALELSRIAPAQWTSFLAIRVVPDHRSTAEDAPPLWGSYEIRGTEIRFEPRFPAEAGVVYRAVFDPARLRLLVEEISPAAGVPEPKAAERRLASTFSVDKTGSRRSTKVAEVYPSGDQLPENLLRFYIHFSAPMSRGEAYRHLKLIDTASRKPVHAPFLELEEELWSPDGTRFTLFIDPGRIKRGLTPREVFGAVLEAGKSYCLIIDPGWADAAGNMLQWEFRRTFRAGPPDESMPDPLKWSVRPAQAGSRDPLVVCFPESLDHALLERLIGVVDPAGQRVGGQISIADAETVWRFVPKSPWRAGTYRLAVGSELEDVAGNSVAQPFEVDVTAPITKRVKSERVEVPFTIDEKRNAP
jgi:hypothetical protein